MYRHAVFDAVNETLRELAATAARESPTSAKLRALKRGLGVSAAGPAQGPTAEQVLSAMRKSAVQLGESIRTTDGALLEPRVEDLGALVRTLWERLLPVWTEPRAAELVSATAEEPDDDIIDDYENEASLQQERLQRARDAFWQWREREILTPDELHGALWQALGESVSPPFPSAEEVSARVERQAARKRAVAVGMPGMPGGPEEQQKDDAEPSSA